MASTFALKQLQLQFLVTFGFIVLICVCLIRFLIKSSKNINKKYCKKDLQWKRDPETLPLSQRPQTSCLPLSQDKCTFHLSRSQIFLKFDEFMMYNKCHQIGYVIYFHNKIIWRYNTIKFRKKFDSLINVMHTYFRAERVTHSTLLHLNDCFVLK